MVEPMTEREYYQLYERWNRSPEANKTRAYLRKCGADYDTAVECYHLALTDYLAYVANNRPIDTPAAWLHTNTWRKYLRMNNRGANGQAGSLAVEPPDTDPPHEGGESADKEEEISTDPTNAAFVSHDVPIEEILDQPYRWALSQLTERQLEVIRLTLDEDPPLDEEEIAIRMNTTEGTVQQYRHAALQRIRKSLESIGYGYLLPKRRTRTNKNK
jgi:DNA-directed RNA polymerase specialized sigma24 family protein